jgi:hypothetical protein
MLALKENLPRLYENATLWMEIAFDAGRLEVLETLEKDPGRLETRQYAARWEWLDGRDDCASLQALGHCH